MFLFRIKNISTFQERGILFKAVFEAQLKDCPLIWMFCSRSANNKISKLHERALRIVYDDCNSKFEKLLTKDVLLWICGLCVFICSYCGFRYFIFISV